LNAIPYGGGAATNPLFMSPVNNAVVCTNGSAVPSECGAVPNGVTATTQSASDNTTKLATDAFVQSQFPIANVQVGNSVAYGLIATNISGVDPSGATSS